MRMAPNNLSVRHIILAVMVLGAVTYTYYEFMANKSRPVQDARSVRLNLTNDEIRQLNKQLKDKMDRINWQQRSLLNEDFAAKHHLKGATTKNVLNLIGPPDEIAHNPMNMKPGEEIWSYEIERPPEPLPPEYPPDPHRRLVWTTFDLRIKAGIVESLRVTPRCY